MQDKGDDIQLNLTFREKLDIGIQTCLDLIPSVGSFLLKSYGYIIMYRDTYIASESARGMEADFGDKIELSPFGRKFCEFCLTEK